MDNGSEDRKNLKFTEIDKLSEDLAVDYNELFYGEFGLCRYSMNHVLRNYAGLGDDFKIHGFFEHGILITDLVEGAFRVHEYLPSIVPSKYRYDVLKNEPNFKGAYAIGPYIHYANSLLTNDEFNAEKERLGKNLLVFPTHSIDGIIKKFNFDNFCNEINEVANDFDSVRVCMYYKDILLKNHVPYKEKGFEIVTAGHFNDYNFIPRLKSIIETSDMTMSNDIATHLGYCIYLGKPHYLTTDGFTFVHEKDHEDKLVLQIERNAEDKFNKSENTMKIKKAFSSYDNKITKEQYDLISYLWGFDCIKTPDELKKIFLDLDDNYSVVKYYFSQLKRLKDLIKIKYFNQRKI